MFACDCEAMLTKQDPGACAGPGFLGGGKRQAWIVALGADGSKLCAPGTPLSIVTCWHWEEDTLRKQEGAVIPLSHKRPFLGTQESKPPGHESIWGQGGEHLGTGQVHA